MGSLAHDLRHALRSVRLAPGWSLIVILTLALGIGASTAMFTLVDSVLLSPLAYPDPDRLVMVWETNPRGEARNVVSPANFFSWREQIRSFGAFDASVDQLIVLAGDGEAEQVVARYTTGDYLSTLGTAPRLGRVYREREEADNVVVLGDRLWRTRFGADPDAIGRSVQIGGAALTIVGVMPPDFHSVGGRPDLWMPTELGRASEGRFLHVTARLRPGATIEQASAEMSAIAARLAAAFPERNTGWGANVVPMHEQVTGEARPALLVLLGAVGLLLLIACTNVASLLLARAAARERDLAVRRALGATRGRLVTRALVHSLVLATIGGVLGVAFALAGTTALVRLVPSDLALPRLDEVSIDGSVLAFAVLSTLLTVALFGLVPAVAGSSIDVSSTLHAASQRATGGRHRLRRALVVSEVALAVVLLVGAGLLGRSLARLLAVDTGVQTEGVLTMRLSLSGDDAAARHVVDALLERLRVLPQVRAVAAETFLPFTGQKIGHGFYSEDRPRPPVGEEWSMDLRPVAGDYFATLGIAVLRGRAFDRNDDGAGVERASDDETAPTVFVVNQELVRRHFPDRDPIGKRIGYEWLGGSTVSGEIVGVVADVREMGPDEPPSPAIYRPFAQQPSQQLTVLVRTTGEPLALESAARAAVHETDAQLAVSDVRTMERIAADTVLRPRFNVTLLGAFAAAALLLAALGLYGIVSYSVAQRRAEIGVRMALGARGSDVLRLIVRQGMGLTLLGLAIGIAAALLSTRAMTSLLFGVEPGDPLTLIAVALFLTLVALAACWVPARRAARVDPTVALRSE